MMKYKLITSKSYCVEELHDVESLGLYDIFSYYPVTFEASSMNLNLVISLLRKDYYQDKAYELTFMWVFFS
jgi:hypothetical protein